jgi:hypothetical protein
MVSSVATEKIPSVTPPGIDPVTVRLIAKCLNHYVILNKEDFNVNAIFANRTIMTRLACIHLAFCNSVIYLNV